MQFIGIGALNLDRLYKVSKIAAGDEELPVEETNEEPGGSAANTIYALGKLKQRAGFIGTVGNDDEGRKLLGSLNSVGVDTSHIKIKANSRTGLVIGLVDSKGERALYIAPGANNLLSEKDIDNNFLMKAEIIHLSSFVEEKQFDAQKKLVEVLDRDVNKLSFAPGSLYVRRGLDALSSIIKRCHVLFLNEQEAKILTDKNYESASKYLIDMGCKMVAITLKEKGCFVTDGTSSEHVEAIKTNVIDTTGAGDAFCAGFLYGLSQEKKLEDCAFIGNHLASKCISEMGARKGLPDKEELDRGLADIF